VSSNVHYENREMKGERLELTDKGWAIASPTPTLLIALSAGE
jgi:hypothetical protein